MRGFIDAIGLFTVLPAPVRDLDRRSAAAAMRALPLVGLIIGLIAGAVGVAAVWRTGSPLLGAVLAVVTLALVNGALHLDGLADTADGLGSRKPAHEALVIMRKSDVGPMGVAALVLAVFVQVSALGSLASLRSFGFAIVSGVVVSRMACVLATGTWLPSARTSGFGAFFSGVTSKVAAVVTLALGFATITGAALFVDVAWWSALGSAAVALVASQMFARWFTRRLGGLTGDTFGAIIELTFTAFVLVSTLVGA